MRIRHKNCQQCGQPQQVLYRVKTALNEDWLFVCQGCLPTVKQDNKHYQYGGTWKSRKR